MYRAFTYISSLCLLVLPALAAAHGFGQRIDLPVPLYLYLFGGGALVALSFILLGLVPNKLSGALHAYPKYDLTRLRWFRVIASQMALMPLKLLFVIILLVAVASGIWGDQNPAFNMLPTVVWILFAIGIPFVSAIIGNIWHVINPLKTLFEYAEALLRRFNIVTSKQTWPLWLGVWPAFVLFFAFRWVENISFDSSTPFPLALFVLLYMSITFAGMAFFGKKTWLENGDPFSVFFSFLSRFSITEVVQDKEKTQVLVRPPAVGLLQGEATMSQVAFVLLMLSSVAADGMLSTSFFQSIFSFLFMFGFSWTVAGTVGLVGLFVTFVLVYGAFSFLTKIVASDTSTVFDIARRFIYALLPISIAYEIAHYLSILVVEGQRIVYLISNPFGFGWNLFGTADYSISYTVLNLKMLWNVQVALIVIGHVVAVIIAHAIAERYFKDSRKALISQYPMLALMIFYSCLSLWIMAQPIVAVE